MTKQEIIENIDSIYFKDAEFRAGDLLISSYCEEGDWTIEVLCTTDGETQYFCYLDYYEDDYEAMVKWEVPSIDPKEMFGLIEEYFEVEE